MVAAHMKALVTGASGFIGGYLIEQLISDGHEVVALCQPASALQHLRKQGVRIAIGDVTDKDTLREPTRGQDCIFHCAAIVGGYGNWQKFHKVGVAGTQNLITAAVESSVTRFIHLSSISVYGTRPHGELFTESTPFDPTPEPWNHYVRQKILSEQLVWRAHDQGKIQATALRPSLVLGPRDRNVVRRTLNIIRSPFGAIVGSGTNRVPCVVVEELVPAIVRSATLKSSIGKSYNLSGRTPITQLEYMNLHASAAGLRCLKRKIPFRLAHASLAALEGLYRAAQRVDEPYCTRIALAFAANDFNIDCSLAKRDLSWKGEASYEEAIFRAVEWILKWG